MVLKNFVHYLINKYLKNYIERLDYEKLDFSLKNGHVLLENLRLKPESLAYLNIPATVSVGYMERLQLNIPWTSLGSKPTEVYIDGLYLLIVSKNELRQDLTEHYADKMVRVEEKVNKLRSAAQDSGKFHAKDSAFVDRMRLQIKQNLIIKIRNLHVCYERKSSEKLGHPFSFGMTLHYLELTTVTNIRTRRRIRANILLTYKIKEINSLSFYWNTKCKSRENASFHDIVHELKSKIATNNHIPNNDEMNYILRPVNLRTEFLIILKPKEHHYERSTLLFDIQVFHIDFHLDMKQLSDLLDFVKFQNYTTIHDRCREYRELLWKNAIDQINLSQNDKQRIRFLETKLDVFHLAYIRHKVEMEIQLFSGETNENNSNQTDLYQRSLSNNSHNSESRNRHRWNAFGRVKNKLNQINRVLDQLKTATSTVFLPYEREFLFEDLPKFDVEMLVNQVNFNLLSPSVNPSDDIIGCINMNDIALNLKRMCISSRVECLLDLHTVRLFGMRHNQQHPPPIVIEIRPSTSYPNIHLEFELFPEDQLSDYRLHLLIQPMRITYDAPTVNRLVESFAANTLLIKRSSAPIKRRTLTEMELHCIRKKIFDMKITLKGVSFLFPQYGVYQEFMRKSPETSLIDLFDPDYSMIRIRSGQFVLKSCINDQEKTTNNEDSLFQNNPSERQFYNKYKFELSDLRVLYIESNKRRLYLLRRTPLIEMNFYKCKISNDATLTKWRMAMKTTMRENVFSKIILMKVINHFNSIPLLYSNIDEIIQRINFYFEVFSPETTRTMDISISNCYLRLLMNPIQTIRTDLHVHLSKKRDEISTYFNAMIILHDTMMINHIFAQMKQTTETFYHRKEHLKLIYSKTE